MLQELAKAEAAAQQPAKVPLVLQDATAVLEKPVKFAEEQQRKRERAAAEDREQLAALRAAQAAERARTAKRARVAAPVRPATPPSTSAAAAAAAATQLALTNAPARPVCTLPLRSAAGYTPGSFRLASTGVAAEPFVLLWPQQTR